MKTNFIKKNALKLTAIVMLTSVFSSFSQDKTKSPFWDKVQFGGGLGLGVGNGFTDITVAPNAIYNLNKYVGLGLGAQVSYNKVKDRYSSILYGVNALAICNPIDEIQLSLEVEQVRVNATYNTIPNKTHDNFWNTALFIGAGYRTGNVTAGLRYNLLFNKDKNVYGDALMPFVRVSF